MLSQPSLAGVGAGAELGNIVSTGYNMAVWLAEGLVTILVKINLRGLREAV